MRTRGVVTAAAGGLACFVSAAVAAAADDGGAAGCTLDKSGFYYDVTSLRGKEDYLIKTGTREFRLNVCGAVTSETWKMDHPELVGALYRGDRSDLSIGTANASLRLVDTDVVMVFQNGAPCDAAKGSGLRMSSAVRFICDNNVFGPGKPQLVAELPPGDDKACAFLFEWRTHVACPTSRPSRIGALIMLVIAMAGVLFATYVVVGVLYRRFALGHRGMEQLPRMSVVPLWEVPRLFEAGLDWLRDVRDHVRGGGGRDLWPRGSGGTGGRGTRGSWGRGGGGGGAGYTGLAQEEREAMFRDDPERAGGDGRFSVEGDEDEAADERELPPLPAKDVAGKGNHTGSIRL